MAVSSSDAAEHLRSTRARVTAPVGRGEVSVLTSDEHDTPAPEDGEERVFSLCLVSTVSGCAAGWGPFEPLREGSTSDAFQETHHDVPQCREAAGPAHPVPVVT